ncbi:hypothetical protein BDZ91DRAFT_300125 [Kalaharituber pfeilii]|nr:hypothetical protein BDZ91DRAFT_300125 [Kalaharituber pfeilii]
MPVKRISLQLRTKTTVTESAIPEQPITSSTSQDILEASKPDSVVNGRPSRLKPTVPLHMTTRRHKSVLESSQQQTTTFSETTDSTVQGRGIKDMPPKRIHATTSEAQVFDEHLKKRLRATRNSTTSLPRNVAAAQETNNIPRAFSRDAPLPPIPPKRPRGRPPLKPKPSISIEKNESAGDHLINGHKGGPPQTPELKSVAPSSSGSEIPPKKYPKKDLMAQFHQKKRLALKHASTEQIRRRQARLAAQYSALAQLAKKNNMLLVDKSIQILSNVADVDLARTEWVQNILAGLEKREEARMKQIHFEKKVNMINALHAYNAERERLENEYNRRYLELQDKYMGKAIEETTRLQREHAPLQPFEHTDFLSEPLQSSHTKEGTGGLTALIVLAERCAQEKTEGVFTGIKGVYADSSASLLQPGLVQNKASILIDRFKE